MEKKTELMKMKNNKRRKERRKKKEEKWIGKREEAGRGDNRREGKRKEARGLGEGEGPVTRSVVVGT